MVYVCLVTAVLCFLAILARCMHVVCGYMLSYMELHLSWWDGYPLRCALPTSMGCHLGEVHAVNTDWTAPKNMFSCHCSTPPPPPPPPQFILTMEVAAPENMYIEVAAPENVYVEVATPKQVYITRGECQHDLVWCSSTTERVYLTSPAVNQPKPLPL